MNTRLEPSRNAAFEHRLAMLAASFTAASSLVRRDDVEPLNADLAFRINSRFSLVAWLLRLRDRLALNLQRRAAIAELQALNDATLADIGVPRHMIATVINERFEDRHSTERPVTAVLTRQRTGRVPAALKEASNAPRFDSAA